MSSVTITFKARTTLPTSNTVKLNLPMEGKHYSGGMSITDARMVAVWSALFGHNGYVDLDHPLVSAHSGDYMRNVTVTIPDWETAVAWALTRKDEAYLTHRESMGVLASEVAAYDDMIRAITTN